MVKKIGVFITILGLFFVGIPQFNSKALIYNGVDYRVLETGEPIETSIYGELNPVLINADHGGTRISDWLYYMQVNDIHRIEMQASNVSTIYFYFSTGLDVVDVAENVFKIVIGYDTGVAYFYMHLYGINQVLITEYVFASGPNVWIQPSNLRILTNINFQTGSNLYSDGYRNGFREGKTEGLIEGEDIGYIKGLNEVDATGFGGLLTAVFGGLGGLLAVELLPGIHIGAIVAVPLVFGIIFFILGKRKGD